MFYPVIRAFQEIFEKIMFYFSNTIFYVLIIKDQILEEYTKIEDMESF